MVRALAPVARHAASLGMALGLEPCNRYETHLLDTHDHPVCDEVWELFGEACQLGRGRSTLLEWDAHIPSFEEVRDEAWKAKAWRDSGAELRA